MSSNPRETYGDDDREMSSGEWVDKVMVNKQDPINGLDNSLECWEAENGTDVFYQKYLSNSSKLYPEKSYKLFPTGNTFDIATTDDLDELDAATSDSSEPDLLWQLNHHPKLNGLTSGVGLKPQKPIPKQAKSPELRYACYY